jgi:hypothetical protein
MKIALLEFSDAHEKVEGQRQAGAASMARSLEGGIYATVDLARQHSLDATTYYVAIWLACMALTQSS